ncbi:MAG: LOG family protein [Nitrospinae bacterium]|nr:LOG family protein [Nitrospinota bacterium]
MGKPHIGVMGSAAPSFPRDQMEHLQEIAWQLGRTIAMQQGILVIGSTVGLPGMVCEAVRKAGGFTVEISPASSAQEHQAHDATDDTRADVRIFTGFGFKGRNVISVRTSDIVIIFGGSMGTFNEFTIAYDEGKIIGVLEGTGGVADGVRSVMQFCNKPTLARVVFERDPARLLQACLALLHTHAPTPP